MLNQRAPLVMFEHRLITMDVFMGLELSMALHGQLQKNLPGAYKALLSGDLAPTLVLVGQTILTCIKLIYFQQTNDISLKT